MNIDQGAGSCDVEPTDYGLRLVFFDSYTGPRVIRKYFFEPGEVRMSTEKYFSLRANKDFCARIKMVCRYKAGRLLRFGDEVDYFHRDELELKAWVWILQIGDEDKQGREAGPGYYITSIRNRLKNAYRDAGRKKIQRHRYSEYVPPKPKKRPRGRPKKQLPPERKLPYPRRIDPYAEDWHDQPVEIFRKSIQTVSGSMGKVVNESTGELETDTEFEEKMKHSGEKSGKRVSGEVSTDMRDIAEELFGQDDGQEGD